MLRVHLFGGLAVVWDDFPLPTIPSPGARSLFAFLITYRDRPHTRDLLAGTFWPDLPDATARRRLSKALWQIRHVFRSTLGSTDQDGTGVPPTALLTEGDTVQLNPELPLWLDQLEFEQQVTVSRQRKFGLAVDALLRAAELYRGEFLAGYYDDWAVVERERLQDMWLEALGRLVAGYKGRGEYEPALSFARRLAAEEPWREESHREVMRLCHLLGEDAKAVRQFETCRQSLAEELGVVPSPETMALADEIATQSGLSRPPLLPAKARLVTAPLLERPDRLPLVGRRKTLGGLLRQVEAAVEGSGGLIVVHGEAGVGKSRLMRELAANAQWRGLPTAWGHCYELATPPAYQPVVEALRARLPALEGPALRPLWRAELSRLIPELATDQVPVPLPPEEEQRRLLEAIAQGFLALAESEASLVILEDAQWMDPASLEALRYLLPRLVDVPLLVVITARAEELEGRSAEALSAMESTRLGRRLELGRLDPGGTEELVQHALGLEEPAPHFSARLHSETEGNPFFLVETLWALVEEGLLYRDEAGAWSTRWDESTEDYAELPLPPGVVQSIERRLDRLPSGLNELLNLAAVIGRRVDFAVWLAASRRDEAGLLLTGDELGSRGLLLAGDPTAPGDADYVFSHDQIRRVAYRRLAPPRRRLYHRRIAQVLEDLAPREPAALAYHWTQAEMWDRAVASHRLAGDRAASVHAHAEAVDHYTRALQALEALTRQTGHSDPVCRFELHLDRETELGREGRRVEQANDLAALEALAEELDDDQRRTMVALHQGTYHTEISDWPTALMYLERALSLARETGDRRMQASGLAVLSRVYGYMGDFRGSLSYREEALAVFQSLGDRQQEARNLCARGTLHLAMGHHTLAQECCERALALCRALGDLQGEAQSLYTLSRTLGALGDLAQAREYMSEAQDIALSTGDRYVEAYYRMELGNHNYRLGDYLVARELLEQADTIFLQIDETRGHAYALVDLGLVVHALGDDQTALDCCTQGRDTLRTVGDRWGEAGCLQHLGLVMEGLGDFDSAADVYTQASTLNLEVEQPVRALENRLGLARVALAHDRIAEALELVEGMEAWTRDKGIQGLDFPFVGYMTVYRVFAAAGHSQRAKNVLTEAYDALMDRADRLSDPIIRDRFLRNIAIHREVIATYHGLQTSEKERQITLSLPRAKAPLGRPLREDEFVNATWTIATPEDDAISNKVARRRQRILRLLREAQAKGAAPTHSHLAKALGVSRRTIERDMAAMRRQADLALPPTRGEMSE